MAETVLYPQGPLLIVDRGMRKRRGQQIQARYHDEDKDVKISVMDIQHSGKSSKQVTPSKTGTFRFVQGLSAEGKPAKRKMPKKVNGCPRLEKQHKSSTNKTSPQRPGSAVSTSTTSTHAGSPLIVMPPGSSLPMYARDYGIQPEALTLLPFFLDTSKFFYPHQDVLALTYDPVARIYFPEALTDECCISAIIYTVSARLQYKYNMSQSPEKTVSLHQHSISGLRKRIATGRISVHTICAATILATYEYCNGGEKASDAHIQGILQLIEARGGFDLIDKRIQVKIYRALLAPTMDKLSRPCFPQISRQFLPLTQILGSGPDEDHQYAVNWLYHDLHPVVLDSLRQLHQLTKAINIAVDNGLKVDPFSLDEDIIYLQYELLALDNTDHSNLDTACKLAALIYLKILSRENPFERECITVAGDLRKAYGSLSTVAQSGSLGLWVVVLGMLISQQTKHRSWFSSKLQFCCCVRDISTTQQLQQAMARTIWIPVVLDPCLHSLHLQF